MLNSNQKKIIKIIKSGGVVILPTDTVYGIFCSAFDKKEVKKIYKIKGRDFSKPLQVFFSEKKSLKKYCVFNKKQKIFLNKHLPGPYTLIFKLKPQIKKLFSFLQDTIGVRIIKSRFLNQIIKYTGILAATSANISGDKTPVLFNDISKSIIKKVDYFIIDDNLIKGKPSKVIDLTDNKMKILRK